MSTPTRSRSICRSVTVALAIGLLVASARSPAQCVSGNNTALQFDGVNDWVMVPNIGSGVIDGYLDFCFEAWFRTSATGLRTIFSRGNANVGGISYALRVSSALQVVLLINNSYASYSGGSGLNDGAWHHAAVTREQGGVITMYVDGQYVDAWIQVGNIGNSAAGVLAIGAQAAGNTATPMGGTYWAGGVDEVRIWSVGRSQNDINSTRFSVLNGSEPGLAGYWRLNEGAGQPVLNSATATGAALNGMLGANTFIFNDDPAWTSTNTAPLVHCVPGTGQANSAAASLRINGAGGDGVQGPFTVTVPTTGPAANLVTLSWQGPSNAPLILLAGTPQTSAAILPCSGSLDLSLAGLAVVGDFNTSPFPLNLLFILDGNGRASTTFTVPSVLLGNPWVTLQGAVFAPSCAPIPYKLTAAHTIR